MPIHREFPKLKKLLLKFVAFNSIIMDNYSILIQPTWSYKVHGIIGVWIKNVIYPNTYLVDELPYQPQSQGSPPRKQFLTLHKGKTGCTAHPKLSQIHHVTTQLTIKYLYITFLSYNCPFTWINNYLVSILIYNDRSVNLVCKREGQNRKGNRGSGHEKLRGKITEWTAGRSVLVSEIEQIWGGREGNMLKGDLTSEERQAVDE